MRGLSFVSVGNGEDLSIKKDISFTNPVGGIDADNADKIRIWNPALSMYVNYFYYVEDGDGYEWHEENWLDEDEDPAVAAKYQGKIPAYQGFWYQPLSTDSAEREMTVSGAVDTDIYDPFQITDGKLHVFVNPYPVETRIKDITSLVVTNPTGGIDADNADKIRVWNPDLSMYVNYFYYVEDGDGYEWHEENWLDEDEDPAVAAKYQGKIPAGQAFWYQTFIPSGESAKTDKTLQFVCPF
jgi:hypothetical protein